MRSTVFVTIAGLGLSFVSLFAVFLSSDCQFRQSGPDCTPTPDAILATLPLIGTTLLAYATLIGNELTVFSFRTRAVEREIRLELRSQDLEQVFQSSPIRELWLVSTAETDAALSSLSTGRRPARVIVGSVFAFVVGLYGLTIVVAGIAVAVPWRLAMVFVYGTALAAIVRAMIEGTVRGREFYWSISDETTQRVRSDTLAPQKPRRTFNSLAKYLLLPRPQELVKWIFFPVAYLVGLYPSADRPLDFTWESSLVRGFIFWFTIEYLLYSARYQLNDIRGVDEDASHPQGRSRGRLPVASGSGGLRTAVRASLAVLLVRLWLVLIVSTLPTDLSPGTGPVLLSGMIVFGIGAVYEYLRAKRPTSRRRQILLSWAIYGAVGLGYSFRAVAGYWSAQIGHVDLSEYAGFASFISRPDVLLLAAFVWAFGSAFVMITWVLDASSYCLDAPIRQATQVRFYSVLSDKYHLETILASLKVPLVAVDAPDLRDRLVDVRTEGSETRTLVNRDWVIAPHNVFTVVGALTAGPCGFLLAFDETWSVNFAGILYTTLVFGIFGIGLSFVSGVSRFYFVGFAAAFAALIVVNDVEPLPSLTAVLVCLLPWVTLSSVVSVFRLQSSSSLKYSLVGSGQILLTRLGYGIGRLVGSPSAEILGLPSRLDLHVTHVWQRVQRGNGLRFVDKGGVEFTYMADRERIIFNDGTSHNLAELHTMFSLAESHSGEGDLLSFLPDRVVRILTDPRVDVLSKPSQAKTTTPTPR